MPKNHRRRLASHQRQLPLRVGVLLAIIALPAIVTSAIFLVEPPSISYRHPAIDYATAPRTDPVTKLATKLRSGEATLAFEPSGSGYLQALLHALHIPVESQTLVFSKTSLQSSLINPTNPRAIYFTDDVAVAWIQGSSAIEIAAHDPRQGVMFYVLNQQPIFRGFQRPRSCLECHVSNETKGVPGLAVGSTIIDENGEPYVSIPIDQRTPIESRWGGWYVTGKTGLGRHLGNAVATSPNEPMLHHNEANFNLRTLDTRLDTKSLATPYSDVAALMVLEHQAHMTNLLTLAGWKFRVANYSRSANESIWASPTETLSHFTSSETVEELVDYMLFIDEAPLTDHIKGTAGFEEKFEAEGPFDRHGRSLRKISLNSRLFRYPCSYMIYTAAFDALPVEVKTAIYLRLWQILSGANRDTKYARLAQDDRIAIIEILRDTKGDLPNYFDEDIR